MRLKFTPDQLVQYIVWYASEQGEVLTPIRLIKFLYLADLYYARYSHGESLTKWPWRFIHYGPFCIEALSAIEHAKQHALIEAIPFESKFDDEEHFFYRCRMEEDPPLREELPAFLTSPLEHAIKRFCGDTYQLLDYVYFETEPMEDVNYQDILDFSKAKRPEIISQIEMRLLSKDKINKAKEAIQKLKKSWIDPKKSSNAVEPIYDDIYYRSLEIMEEDDLSEISATAKIIT